MAVAKKNQKMIKRIQLENKNVDYKFELKLSGLHHDLRGC